VVGLCGGYQMLGLTIADPHGTEGAPQTVPGLGLLAVDTEITAEKSLTEVSGATLADGVAIGGYEMHMGVTTGPDTARPLIRFGDGRSDGAVSADGRVAGTYVHGLFAGDAQRRAWVERLGGTPSTLSHDAEVERTLDALAAHLEAHVEIDRLLKGAR
jgi:adenosylcobyric acid synthase